MATRVKRNRTRASGFRGSLNTQDFPPLALTMPERAIWKFCNVAALLAGEGDYYDLLPPGARMAVDACKRESAQLLKITGGQSHERT